LQQAGGFLRVPRFHQINKTDRHDIAYHTMTTRTVLASVKHWVSRNYFV
jgi:hypothetical protein